MRSQQGSGLVITILLTLVVMSIGIYTLSKIQPFSENIVGLEHSVQARYHAKTGEEVAKLIYYDNLQKFNEQLRELQGLSESEFATTSDTQKQQAFCRTDGELLVNNKEQRRAISQCVKDQTKSGLSTEEANSLCSQVAYYQEYLSS